MNCLSWSSLAAKPARTALLGGLLALAVLHACGADLQAQDGEARSLRLPAELANYSQPALPSYFTAADIQSFDTTPENNRLTDAGATLGRALFYDTRLSRNGSVSCGSCHVQEHAFSDPRQFSTGFNGQQTDRNSMSLNDLRYVRAGFFWDERGGSLEEAVMTPLYSHVEMGTDPERLVTFLCDDKDYASLFAAAFGTSEVTEDRVARALSQFLRAMVSSQSKFDIGAEESESINEEFANFSAAENLGKGLFLEKCAACHTLGQQSHKAIFAMFRSLNNGIDADASARDAGRGDITFNPTELGLFKASSLRNVEYTAPYMHDGRLQTLEDVIDHYSDGVMRHPTLSAVARMNFSAAEKSAMVGFLKTLSDPAFISDPKFSDPWAPDETINALHVSSRADVISGDDDLAALIKAGEGLSAAETAAWLTSLDADQDERLTATELRPLADMLISTQAFGRVQAPTPQAREGRGGRAGGRRGGRGGRGRASDAIESADPAADFNGDGKVDAAEAGSYQSMRKLFEFGDGHRLDVLLDRLFGSFPLDPDSKPAARASIRTAKLRLNDQIVGFNKDTMAKLSKTLGEETTQGFIQAVVAATTGGRRNPIASEGPAQEDVLATLLGFDEDHDSALNATEREALLRELNRLPGGLARRPPPAPEMSQFAERILAFDADGSKSVNASELPERMSEFAVAADSNGDGELTLAEAQTHFTTAAFLRLRDEGIYIGGAFDNTLLFHRQRLHEIGLNAELLEASDAIMDDHAARIKQASAAAFAEQLGVVKKLATQPPRP